MEKSKEQLLIEIEKLRQENAVLRQVELKIQEQLTFSNALNRIAQIVISEDNTQSVLEKLSRISGEGLKTDRSLIYYVDLEKGKVIGLSDWLNPELPDINSTLNTYDLSIFKEGIKCILNSKNYLQSHVDDVHPCLDNDGAELFHKRMSIKSGLWYPFSFRDNGFYLLIFHQVTYRRTWRESELNFLESVSGQVSIALQKIQILQNLKQSGKTLLEKEEHYRALFDLAPYGILLENEDGIILDVNKAFYKSHGYSKEELIGQHITMISHPDEHNQVMENLLQLKKGTVLNLTVKDLKKDGTIRFVQLTERRITLPDGNPGVISISHDITEKIHTEEEKEKLHAQLAQAQKMEAIGNLAGGIAHDFNNLLTAINGYAELMAMQLDKDNPMQHDIAAILHAGDKANNLTRQLLTFSRKQAIEPKILDINIVIKDFDKIFKRLISADIYVETQLKSDIPRIKADPGQLEQILMNLMINSRDALIEAGKTVLKKNIMIKTEAINLDDHFIQQHPGSKKGLHILIAVSDNGIGMDENTQNSIYEPFFTTKEHGKGTGLGLATVYGIVKQNNAAIEVDSKPGYGTTFKIYWPCSIEQDLTEIKIPAKEDNPLGNETILIVEDDKNVRDFAESALRSFGYSIVTASNGVEAIALINEKITANKNSWNLKLVVTDLIMPEMNGEELAEKLKKIMPEIKVIFTSGYRDKKIIPDEETNYIQKPYSVHILARKVREMLDS